MVNANAKPLTLEESIKEKCYNPHLGKQLLQYKSKLQKKNRTLERAIMCDFPKLLNMTFTLHHQLEFCNQPEHRPMDIPRRLS